MWESRYIVSNQMDYLKTVNIVVIFDTCLSVTFFCLIKERRFARSFCK